MCLPLFIHTSIESLFDFATKSTVYYYALDSIRNTLRDLISRIALDRLGSFVAPIFAEQMAQVTAPSVTLFIGGLCSQAIKEIIRAINTLVNNLLGIQEVVRSVSWVNVALHIASVSIGFLANTAFCNYGMPFVSLGIRVAVQVGCQYAPLVFVLSTPAAVLFAPAITFLVADILGTMAQHVSYALFDWVYMQL